MLGPSGDADEDMALQRATATYTCKVPPSLHNATPFLHVFRLIGPCAHGCYARGSHAMVRHAQRAHVAHS